MSSFFDPILTFTSYAIIWCRNIAVIIRTTPFLLFTVGFIAVVYAIVVLGRILNE